MERLHFALLHYGNREDWYVCVEKIGAIRDIHSKDIDGDNGVWIYLQGDDTPIKVTETIDEVKDVILKAAFD